MVNPADIVEALVAALRDIPDLVVEVGSEDRIFAYHDRFPANVSLEEAKYRLQHPAIMVAWQGTRQGSRGGFGAWQHEVSIFLRAGEEYDDPPAAYYKLYRLITKGVPAHGDGLPLIYSTIHPSCDPVGDIPPIARQTDSAGVDYFEVSMSFIEIGDD